MLRPRAIVGVDLFGLPTNFEKIERVAKKYDLPVLEDGAQGFAVLEIEPLVVLDMRANFIFQQNLLVLMETVEPYLPMMIKSMMFSKAIVSIALKVFYSLGDTKVVMRNGVMTVCINIVLTLLLYNPWGLIGITMATTIAEITSCFTILYRLQKKIGVLGLKLINIAMIIPALLILLDIKGSAFAIFLLATTFGGFIYVMCLYLLKYSEEWYYLDC